MRHGLAGFYHELQSLAFGLELDQRAGARTNGFGLPCHIELAARRAMNLETIGAFLVHLGHPHPLAIEGQPTLVWLIRR